MRGETVTLYERTLIGKDELNAPIYDEIPVAVQNVIIAPSTQEDVVRSTNLYGKRAVYTLHIPKKDTHKWEDARVRFYGQEFRAFGPVMIYDEAKTPNHWNAKIEVERYG